MVVWLCLFFWLCGIFKMPEIGAKYLNSDENILIKKSLLVFKWKFPFVGLRFFAKISVKSYTRASWLGRKNLDDVFTEFLRYFDFLFLTIFKGVLNSKKGYSYPFKGCRISKKKYIKKNLYIWALYMWNCFAQK